jgi:hypothetical protein
VLLAPPPVPFAATVVAVSAPDLGASYHAGCPVGPAQLRLVRLSYWGFDGAAHAGSLVVHRDSTRQIVAAFRALYAQRFPIRRMVTVDRYGANDRASMAADNTSAFNCRYASAPGPKRWSAHAFGKAIDVNPVENPYVQGSYVSPPAGRLFADRSRRRPGMAWEGGALVRAFAAIGWRWGGRWSGTPDYQHFSATGG